MPMGGPIEECGFASWVDNNKGLAAIAIVAGFFLLKK